jgi:SAM-dependent methyltransferase
MAFFDWSAPLFHRFGDRWSEQDAEIIAGWLMPHLTAEGAILDLGGGTGALAAHLADATARPVTVLDATPKMLAYLPDRPTSPACRAARSPCPSVTTCSTP